jgi:putative hemolysin
MHSNGSRNPFSVLAAPFIKLAEKVSGLDRLQNVYETMEPVAHAEFPARALEALDISYEVANPDLSQIPTEGPAIIVANHPFGAAEGVIFMDLLQKIRPDARLMANHLLGRIPELHEYLMQVDPFGGKNAARNNIASVRQAINWVKGGGLLVVFPAGEVASAVRYTLPEDNVTLVVPELHICESIVLMFLADRREDLL